jgi:hypothetical protein
MATSVQIRTPEEAGELTMCYEILEYDFFLLF